MNPGFLFSPQISCFLFLLFSSVWLVSCGLRTAPRFIPEVKSKPTFSDLKIQQRDNRVRLSWRINQTERNQRLMKFGTEQDEEDYFLIQKHLIQLNCRNCEVIELPEERVLFNSDSLVQEANQFYYYMELPETGLYIHQYQLSHRGPDNENMSPAQTVRLKLSNLFPAVPVPKLDIVQIEDESQIVRFPFGKVVLHKKTSVSGKEEKIQLKEIGETEESGELPLQMQPLIETRVFILRLSWPQQLNNSLSGISGEGDSFENQGHYLTHLYRTVNEAKWQETPINSVSASNNYYLDKLKIRIPPPNRPQLADTHPDMFNSKILFYIDLSGEYVDTWRYKMRLVDRFGNESEASETVIFRLPDTSILANSFSKKILVPLAD